MPELTTTTTLIPQGLSPAAHPSLAGVASHWGSHLVMSPGELGLLKSAHGVLLVPAARELQALPDTYKTCGCHCNHLQL